MFSSFLRLIRGKPSPPSPGDSYEEDYTDPYDDEDVEEAQPFPVLLMGTAGSGKSTLVKGLRMKSAEAREDQFVQEMVSERRYLQYDLLYGIVKVMARMMSYDSDEYPPLTERELAAYGQARYLLEDIQANGTLKTTERDEYANPATNREADLIPLEKKYWRALELFTRKESFSRILDERFLPESAVQSLNGRPLRLTDGFANFFAGSEERKAEIWNEVVTGGIALQHSTCLLLRNPNGGLFVKSIVKSIERSSDVTLAFTEFPGRLESFADILGNLQNESYQGRLFECIVLVLSYADFDTFVETDNGVELVNDYLFKLLANLNQKLKRLSIYIIMTKEAIFREKIRVYEEHEIFESQLKKANIELEDPSLEAIMRHIQNDIQNKLEAVWCTDSHGIRKDNVVVKRFPRSFLIHSFDVEDVKEIFDHIAKLTGAD